MISVGFFVFNHFFRGKRAARIKDVLSKKRGELGKQQLESLTKSSSIRQGKKKAYVELLGKIYSTFNLQSILSSKELKEDLSQAGFRGKQAVMIYLSARVIGAGGIFILVLIYVNIMPEFPYPGFVKPIFAAIGGAIGFYMPRILVTNAAVKRQKEMAGTFPDALDLMVICVEAGLSIEAAFGRVTEEIMESSAILAQELGLMAAELAYLGDRTQAYKNFATRTGLPAAKSLSTTLIQSEQYGTPVGNALNVLSQEKRDERMTTAEKKAASLPAKLTVPMIIFFLPVLFLVVIGPAAIQIGQNT
ncbi:MAG: type II secretion system F family protein [Rhodospirillales bacterium]